MTDSRRAIPSIGALLEDTEVQDLLKTHPRATVVNAARRAAQIARGDAGYQDRSWAERVEAELVKLETRSLVRVFNATGVILHTNLGRAPLADSAIRAIENLASGYSNLEYDLESGTRGSRYIHCVELLRELTGAEDAIVVNNCAAALVLSLSAIARDRDVIVSRGELVEIGGSFRVPEIMERSGARLVEVGTTNRTHLDDYLRALSPGTGAIAKIHRSNFALSGFVADVPVKALSRIARERDIPIVHDLGSGLMIDLTRFGLTGEPTAREALDAGATLVLMSGDKLLGGPQAGIVLGSANAVARLRKDPFARAMRVDKLTIAALTATLELYRDPDAAIEKIPVLRMIAASVQNVQRRCAAAVKRLGERGITSRVVESSAAVGAGAFPTHEIGSFAISLDGDAKVLDQRLRKSGQSVVGRIANDSLLLDMRSVPDAADDALVDAVIEALA